MEHLDGYVLDDYKFEVKLFDIHAIKQDDWVNIAKEYDMVFLNYTVLDWAFAYMGAPMRGEGKKMIMDIDDAISHVRKDNPTYQQYQANNGKYIYNVNCMLNEVDYVTTTTPYLRNVLVDETSKGYDKIRVIPNCIDLKKYHWRFPPTKKDKITLMYFGSTTHFEDLLQKQFTTGVDRLMEEIPNLQLVTVGAFIPELRDKWGMRYVNDFGDTDVYKWIEFGYPKFMEAADIVVSPLEIDTYNRSKSFIKYLEYSAAKKPGVYQDINQYRDIVEHGKNGFLAQTADNWYTHIKALVTDIDLRKKIGNAAFKTAQEYQIKDWVKKYAELFKSCVVDDKQ
jgi:glycosyltransferase involved in cell wall biosynthesis